MQTTPLDSPSVRTRSIPALWLGPRRGYLMDWITQLWVRSTGRTIALREETWLSGPFGGTRTIAATYFEELARDSALTLIVDPADAGLLDDFSVLESETFSVDAVHPAIKDFYERTTQYELDVWSQWHGVFKPFGRLIAALFSRRLQQLNLPLSPLDTSRGITSRILRMIDATGEHVGTGWLRTMVATQSVIYAGVYSTCLPSGFPGRCMKVVFPLPNGNATVIMKPLNNANGSLTLLSSGHGIGEPGFYFVVRKDGDDSTRQAHIRYLRAMRESIHIYVDAAGALRADHDLRLWGKTFVKIHYHMRATSRK
jgi:hypothetical protein